MMLRLPTEVIGDVVAFAFRVAPSWVMHVWDVIDRRPEVLLHLILSMAQQRARLLLELERELAFCVRRWITDRKRPTVTDVFYLPCPSTSALATRSRRLRDKIVQRRHTRFLPSFGGTGVRVQRTVVTMAVVRSVRYVFVEDRMLTRRDVSVTIASVA